MLRVPRGDRLERRCLICKMIICHININAIFWFLLEMAAWRDVCFKAKTATTRETWSWNIDAKPLRTPWPVLPNGPVTWEELSPEAAHLSTGGVLTSYTHVMGRWMWRGKFWKGVNSIGPSATGWLKQTGTAFTLSTSLRRSPQLLASINSEARRDFSV